MKKRTLGMTLIEVIVSISIVGLLLSLLLPAVNFAREMARGIQCRNNMRQLGLAVQNYENHFGVLPATFEMNYGTIKRGSWSIFARVAPFMEQRQLAGRIDLSLDWHRQQHTGIPASAYPGIVCPSDVGGAVRMKSGAAYIQPTSYGFNNGTWLIHNPTTNEVGDGAFRFNRWTPTSHFTDGLSHTLCLAEVKARTPYLRNTMPSSLRIPSDASIFQGLVGDRKMDPTGRKNTGHTVWCDGRVHHTGFTTTFIPNTFVPYHLDGQLYDIDFNSQQEGRHLTNPTFAAVTSRSFHSGVVHVTYLDGSVHRIQNGIDLRVWRALGTRSGGEVD